MEFGKQFYSTKIEENNKIYLTLLSELLALSIPNCASQITQTRLAIAKAKRLAVFGEKAIFLFSRLLSVWIEKFQLNDAEPFLGVLIYANAKVQ